MSALVPWRPSEGALVPAVGGQVTSYDLSAAEGRKGQYRAGVGSDFQLDDLIDQRIDVEHVRVHWVVDSGPEPLPHGMRLRGVLVTPDGTRISTGSQTALRCMMDAVLIACAAPPFRPPMSFTVRATKRKVGSGHWLWLDWEG